MRSPRRSQRHDSAPTARRRPGGLTAKKILIGACCTFLLVACGPELPGSRGGSTIGTEGFIEAMVDLRLGARDRPGSVLQPQQAQGILDGHGLEPEDLRRFVEVHGQNVPFMNSVWTEVERRVEEGRTPQPDQDA